MQISLTTLFIVFIFLVLFGVVGRVDFQDEAARSEMYCKNVKENIWPDYKRSYKVSCKAR